MTHRQVSLLRSAGRWACAALAVVWAVNPTLPLAVLGLVVLVFSVE